MIFQGFLLLKSPSEALTSTLRSCLKTIEPLNWVALKKLWPRKQSCKLPIIAAQSICKAARMRPASFMRIDHCRVTAFLD